MSTYHLTEAYGDLHNPRVTDSNYFQNLRFVDDLQQNEMQEVMESLIWEFMDYGDSFDEATKILETAFSDDTVLCESLEAICEVTARPFKATTEFKPTYGYQKDGKSVKGGSDSSARARRAERASAVRGALRGAAESVKGALKGFRKQVRDSKTNLAAKGASMALRGQAALSKVARTARGAVRGAKQEWQTPSKPPSSPIKQKDSPSSRISGKEKTQQMRLAARKELGDVFAEKQPSSSAQTPSKIERLRAAAKASKPKKEQTAPKPQEGRAIHGGSWPAPPPPMKRANKKQTPALPPSGKTSGSTKGGRVLTGSQRKMKNAALYRRLNSDFDYDLLSQYMIEDIINGGYATTEDDALFILENMEPEILNELMETYLED